MKAGRSQLRLGRASGVLFCIPVPGFQTSVSWACRSEGVHCWAQSSYCEVGAKTQELKNQSQPQPNVQSYNKSLKQGNYVSDGLLRKKGLSHNRHLAATAIPVLDQCICPLSVCPFWDSSSRRLDAQSLHRYVKPIPDQWHSSFNQTPQETHESLSWP